MTQRERIVFITMNALIFISYMLFIYATIQSQDIVREYKELQSEIYDQKAKNSELYAEYLHVRSLGYIYDVARQQGFVEAQVIFLRK